MLDKKRFHKIFKKAIFPVLGGLVIIALGTICFKTFFKTPVCKNCNVVLISLDTLGANYLPCYGYEKNTAPNLCQFAKDNILFENAYATSYFTLPSHMSIFTGVYASTHGINFSGQGYLNEKYVSLTESLKTKGYNTLYYGPDKKSWGSTFFPFNQGFGRGFDFISENYEYSGTSHWQDGVSKLKENNKNGKPTFLFLHTYAPHERSYPYQNELEFTQWNQDIVNAEKNLYNFKDPAFVKQVVEILKEKKKTTDPELTKRIDSVLAKVKTGNFEESDLKDALPDTQWQDVNWFLLWRNWYLGQVKVDDPKTIEIVKGLYDQRIYETDQKLKQIFDLVNSSEFSKNTILIIVGDHGDAFNEHNTLFHCVDTKIDNFDCLYNENIKVPFIMKIPGIKNKIIFDNTSLVDVFPTVANLVGAKTPKNIEGIDLSGLVYQKLFAKKHKYIASEQTLYKKTIIAGKYKLIASDLDEFNMPRRIELFDLEKDPKEQVNLVKDNKNIVDRLLSYYLEFIDRKTLDNSKTDNQKAPIDNTKKTELMKNGYF